MNVFLRLMAWAMLSLSWAASAGDFEVTAFHDAHFHINNAIQEVDVNFPDDGQTYSTVNLILTLEPPDGLDGDEWDRMGHIYMYNEDGEWTELARLITPFWNPPWTWTLDITEMQLLLRGEKRIGVWLQSWKDDGYQVSVSFDFTYGVPNRLTTQITNMWSGPAFGYGNPGNTRMERFFLPQTVPVSAYANHVISRISVTGHRFVDNSQNAAEFLRAGRTLIVNGGGNWYDELWQECGNWPVQPQSPGTWHFDRSGWCPGDLVDPWIVDVTPQITGGHDNVIEYLADEYINTGTAQDATEYVGSQLIEQRDTNATLWVPTHGKSVQGLVGDDTQNWAQRYTVYNFNGDPVSLTATTTTNWLTVNLSDNQLDAGEHAEISVTINSAVTNLPAGDHEGRITFTDLSNGFAETRYIQLHLEDRQLVAHWKLDETSGTTANDASGNGFHGTLEGGFSFDTNSVAGKDGTALDFDGVDDLVRTGNVPLKGQFSVAAWVQPHDITAVAGFMHKWNQQSQQFLKHSFWFGQAWTDGHVHFGVYPSIFNKGINSAKPDLVNDTWVHLVATYDGTYQKLYVNDELVTTGAAQANGLPDLVGDLILGRRNNANWFNGYLDDVRVYNYALSSEEIHWMLCPLDVNLDGVVNALDKDVNQDNWPDGALIRDVNEDNYTNILDLMSYESHYGDCGN